MNIVFMGTPDFADRSLRQLLDSRHRVAAVYTRKDTPKNRGMKMAMPPVKETALAAGIPVCQPESLRDAQVQAELRAFEPDIIVVAAYGLFLPKAVLEMPKYGCINVHASLLPKYRGASPINAVILEGERESGVTIMQMARGIDTGDMLLSRAVPLAEDETYGRLHDRLADLGGALLLEALDQIEAGKAAPVPQDESLACYAHMIQNGDAFVSFGQPAEVVSRKIRGYDPVPGAFAFLGEEKIKLFAAVRHDDSCTRSPGEILGCTKQGLLVQAEQGTVCIREVQLSGKKRMAADACFRGRPALLQEKFK